MPQPPSLVALPPMPMMINMDRPQHLTRRNLVSRGFTPRRVRGPTHDTLLGLLPGCHALRGDVPGLHRRLLHHIPLRRPDLPRVMLHPARFRKVWIEFLPGDGPDAGVCIENNGPGTGGALIQGEYDLRHSAFLRTLWNEGCRVCTIRQASN